MIQGGKCTCVAVLMMFCVLIQTALASAPRQDNITLIGENVRELVDSLATRMEREKLVCRKIYVEANAQQATLQHAVETSFRDRKLLSADTLESRRLRLEIFENGVLYDRPNGMSSDSVQRTIKTEIYYLLESKKDTDNSFTGNLVVAKCDTVGIDETAFLERGGNPLAKGVMPQSKTPFWKQILTPAIAVGSAIICVVLLFSVRSK